MVDPRQNLTEQVTNEVRTHFDGKVYATTIPRNVRLSEAPSFGKPILLYDIASKGAKSYLDLAREFLARHGDEQPRQAGEAADGSRRRGDGGLAMSAPKRKALGRGLAALIPGARSPSAAGGGDGRSPAGARSDGTRTIAIEDVHPSPGQPRTHFDDARLDELAASIRTQGIIQPLIVRARADGGYELIAGERRWRAAQRAGPARGAGRRARRRADAGVRDGAGREPAARGSEPARGGGRLSSASSRSSATRRRQLAERVGKDRSTVANALRLLRLPESVRALLAEGRLSMGHARALLGLESRPRWSGWPAGSSPSDLSVRKVEELVRRDARTARRRSRPRRPPRTPPSTSARDLGDAPDARARHAGRGHRGRARSAARSRSTTTRSISSTRSSNACAHDRGTRPSASATGVARPVTLSCLPLGHRAAGHLRDPPRHGAAAARHDRDAVPSGTPLELRLVAPVDVDRAPGRGRPGDARRRARRTRSRDHGGDAHLARRDASATRSTRLAFGFRGSRRWWPPRRRRRARYLIRYLRSIITCQVDRGRSAAS